MTSNQKRILIPLAILIIAVLIFAGLMATKKNPPRKPDDQKTPFVALETVQLAPLTLTVKSQGLVQPKYDTQLLAQVSGEITELSEKFLRGGLVRKGELLAQIDPFNYDVRLQQAKATLASARTTFIQESAQGRVAEAEWKKITSAEPSDLGLRKPQQERALAAVKAAEAGVLQATKDLQRTRITAPYDALVAARHVSPGTFVNTGTVIGKVLDIEVAEVRLPIAGKELLYLKNRGIDAPVTLTTTLAGKTFKWQARIDRDEGVVDETSRMIYLVAQFEDPYNLKANHTYRLSFGTYVTAEIAGRLLPSAARVPRALLRDNQLALFSNNTLNFTDVEVARHEDKFSIITAGLKSGDLLITSSLEYPVEGMALTAEISNVKPTPQPLTTAEPQPTTDEES